MGQVTPLLEFLENAGLVHGSRINESRIRRLSATRLSDIGEEAAAITRADDLTPAIGAMSHAATLSLGGGAETCSNVACRIRRIDQLGQFAALYSDRVYIENFLRYHEHGQEGEGGSSTTSRREMLVDDLKVLMRVRPLIEAGLVVPVTISDEVCVQCITLGAFGASADKRFLRERKSLAARFLEEMTLTIEYQDGEWCLAHEAPEELLEHGGLYLWGNEPPRAVARMGRSLDRARSGERVKLSKSAIRKLGAHEALTSLIFDNLIFEMATAQILGASYLSELELPLQLLTAVSGDPDVARRKHLGAEASHFDGAILCRNLAPSGAAAPAQRGRCVRGLQKGAEHRNR